MWKHFRIIPIRFDELPKAAVPRIYDGDAPSIIGPKDQVDDLNELNLSDRTRQIIEHGRIGRGTKAKDDTGSVWRFDGLCSMFREGVAPEQALGILTDGQYGISAGVVKKSNPEKFARDEVTRAWKKIAAENAEDLAALTAQPIEDGHLESVLAADKKKRIDGIARFKAIWFGIRERAGSAVRA